MLHGSMEGVNEEMEDVLCYTKITHKNDFIIVRDYFFFVTLQRWQYVHLDSSYINIIVNSLTSGPLERFVTK